MVCRSGELLWYGVVKKSSHTYVIQSTQKINERNSLGLTVMHWLPRCLGIYIGGTLYMTRKKELLLHKSPVNDEKPRISAVPTLVSSPTGAFQG